MRESQVVHGANGVILVAENLNPEALEISTSITGRFGTLNEASCKKIKLV